MVCKQKQGKNKRKKADLQLYYLQFTMRKSLKYDNNAYYY